MLVNIGFDYLESVFKCFVNESVYSVHLTTPCVEVTMILLLYCD